MEEYYNVRKMSDQYRPEKTLIFLKRIFKKKNKLMRYGVVVYVPFSVIVD